jgi:hypothetical protein
MLTQGSGRGVTSLILAILFSLVPTASIAATPSPSPTPDSPTYFRSSALGDLADLKKDVVDAQRALEKGGSWRLLGNAAELAFNIGQLQALTPPTKYAKTWNKQLTTLDGLSTQFMDSISSGSVSTTRSILKKMLTQAKAMETYVKKVK